jgi:tetratricopeptide (TPR) repeat protein
VIRSKDLESLLQSARLGLSEQAFERSLDELAQAEKLAPENLEVHYLLGLALSRIEDYENAIPHLENVLNSEYGHPYMQQVCMLLGVIAVRWEDYPSAEQFFLRALQYNPQNDSAYAALGHVYFMRGAFEKAEKALREGLVINPNNHNARNSLAYVYCEGGNGDEDVDRALLEAQQVTKAEPDNYAFLDTLGWIYHKKGKEALARETLKKALDAAPEHEEIKEHLRVVLDIQ